MNPYNEWRIAPAAPARPTTVYTGDDAADNERRDAEHYQAAVALYQAQMTNHEHFLAHEDAERRALADACTREVTS
jgi:hypothetical protein